MFGAAVMSIRRAGMVASLILMLFLLTGGYYVQVRKLFFFLKTPLPDKLISTFKKKWRKIILCMVLLQHIPKFMQWMKYISFMYHGFRLLMKVQYSSDDLYECESIAGCRSLQTSPSFDTVNLKGGWKEVWILLGMGLVYRILAYICLRQKISLINLWLILQIRFLSRITFLLYDHGNYIYICLKEVILWQPMYWSWTL